MKTLNTVKNLFKRLFKRRENKVAKPVEAKKHNTSCIREVSRERFNVIHHGNEEYYPKRKKLKGWQKENRKYSKVS